MNRTAPLSSMSGAPSATAIATTPAGSVRASRPPAILTIRDPLKLLHRGLDGALHRYAAPDGGFQRGRRNWNSRLLTPPWAPSILPAVGGPTTRRWTACAVPRPTKSSSRRAQGHPIELLLRQRSAQPSVCSPSGQCGTRGGTALNYYGPSTVSITRPSGQPRTITQFGDYPLKPELEIVVGVRETRGIHPATAHPGLGPPHPTLPSMRERQEAPPPGKYLQSNAPGPAKRASA